VRDDVSDPPSRRGGRVERLGREVTEKGQRSPALVSKLPKDLEPGRLGGLEWAHATVRGRWVEAAAAQEAAARMRAAERAAWMRAAAEAVEEASTAKRRPSDARR
jgi:hypothetical protein